MTWKIEHKLSIVKILILAVAGIAIPVGVVIYQNPEEPTDPEPIAVSTLTALPVSDEGSEREPRDTEPESLPATEQFTETEIDPTGQIPKSQTEIQEEVKPDVPAKPPATEGTTVVVHGRPSDLIYLVEDPPRLVQQVIRRASGPSFDTYKNIDVVLPQLEGMIENDLSDHQVTVDEDIAVSDELLYLLIFKRGDSSYAKFQEFPRDETIVLP